jgi:hypothetical protein
MSHLGYFECRSFSRNLKYFKFLFEVEAELKILIENYNNFSIRIFNIFNWNNLNKVRKF